MKTFIVIIKEISLHKVVVDAVDKDAAKDIGLEQFYNNVDVDYAVDCWIETVDAEEEFEEGEDNQTTGDEEARRQSRPDDVT